MHRRPPDPHHRRKQSPDIQTAEDERRGRRRGRITPPQQPIENTEAEVKNRSSGDQKLPIGRTTIDGAVANQSDQKISSPKPILHPKKKKSHRRKSKTEATRTKSRSRSKPAKKKGDDNKGDKGDHHDEKRKRNKSRSKSRSRSKSNTRSRSKSGGDDSRRKHKPPELFSLALKQQWAYVVLRCTTHPDEASYVRTSDGLTTLHLAVMSRAIRSKCKAVKSDCDLRAVGELVQFEAEGNAAPLDVIRALIKAFPGATRQRCKLIGYTPLAYSCLVPPIPPLEVDEHTVDGSLVTEGTKLSFQSQNHDPDNYARMHHEIFDQIILGPDHATPHDLFQEADKLVSALVEADRESVSLISKTRLSPLDIHIISYSKVRGIGIQQLTYTSPADESGKTTTLVLRTLLQAMPSLARPKITSSRSGVTNPGPLEYLYRCNSAAYIDAVEKHTYRNDIPKSRFSRLVSASLASSRSSTHGMAINKVGSWWIWQWTIILLKYGVLNIKIRGKPFSALHAAGHLEGCPPVLIILIARVFPAQASTVDAMVDSGKLPLHLVCRWGYDRHLDQLTSSRKGIAIGALLAEFPDGAKAVDADGRLPLVYAIESNTSFNDGLGKLIDANPIATRTPDPLTRLYPFQLAAVVQQKDSAAHLSTIFQLLRGDPAALQHCLSPPLANDEGWANFDDWESAFDSGDDQTQASTAPAQRNLKFYRKMGLY